jgi:hypothetical protein
MSWFVTSAGSGERLPSDLDQARRMSPSCQSLNEELGNTRVPVVDAGSPTRTCANQAPQSPSGFRKNRAGSKAGLFVPILALGALCGACSDLYYARRDLIVPYAGDALASDKAVQTIDPWPPGSGNRRIAFNGQRMQAAVARYRNNKVTLPQPYTASTALPVDTSAPAAPAAILPGQ